MRPNILSPRASDPPEAGPSAARVRLLVSAWLVLTCHGPLLRALLRDRPLDDLSTWGFLAACALALLAIQGLLLSLLAPGPLLRPMATVLLVVGAGATHFMETFGAYLDPSMLRNAMRTDVGEARELLSLGMAWRLLWQAGLPAALLWRRPVRRRPFGPALRGWLLGVAGALVLMVGAVMAVFQPMASLMRQHKEVRYLVTPANVLWSSASVLAGDLRGAARPREPIGLDAAPGPRLAARTRPLVVVMVVGETVRAANWGLSGYARPTTPELARLGPAVISFPRVTSCGTNTEVSLPCMFAPVGRRDHDESRIRGSQSLLHVMRRAGVDVLWRDNQSGCKGVCEGLPAEEMAALNPPGLCADGRCLDEALLHGLDAKLDAARGTGMIVLHMLGNHGPSYFRRYPPAFERHVPACRQDDLRQCSVAEIVNAYDNAILYTDHLLATLIGRLQARQDRTDSVLLYVSDHGESLGEANLFLHGLPWAIAPDVQKQVPMVMWFSAGAPAATGVDPDCLRRRAAQPAEHDHLFHTLLALTDVRTALHDPAWDLTQGCRRDR